MPDPTFRGDPYRVLEVRADASNAQIKRRWRDLAREHHPDRAAGDRDEAARLTRRMARINAAYDLLRDPARRARFDSSAEGRRARSRAPGAAAGEWAEESAFETDAGQRSGPPPPPRTPPVTARFDTSASFRPRNATLDGRSAAFRSQPLRGQRPRSRRDRDREAELRASTPTGPVQRQQGERVVPVPTLREARETTLNFGRFHGYTLGEVELIEPTYLEWVARTITRDRDLVMKARVIQNELDRPGVERRSRAAASAEA